MSQSNLKHFAEYCQEKILNAELHSEPFEHIIVDNFLPEELAQECLDNFPALNDPSWSYSNDEDIEVKYRTTWESEFDIPDGIVDAIRILNSSHFLKPIADKIGIQKLISDPYFAGGGLNVCKRGGLLDVHVDGNYHDATGLNRRLNAILFLNPDYQEGWGGEFGIYDKEGEECVKKVQPLYNRLVVFNTHDKSYHGLPDPINFPFNELRRSIILYYYTKDPRPGSDTVVEEPHSALWKKRNFTDKRGNKTRDYV